MKATIAKSDWLAAQQCQAMAWYAMRDTRPIPTEVDRFRMEQGQEVGALARQLFPHGIFVSPRDGRTAEELTRSFIADEAVTILFEASFSHGPFVAKADVLERQPAGWHVLEVKSSLAGDKKVKELLGDLAYTVMVLRGSGLAIVKSSLILLSRDYRFGQPNDRLFDIIDATAESDEVVAQFGQEADRLARELLGDETPSAALVSACRDCGYFKANCLGVGIEHTVLELSGLHHARLRRLAAAGIVDLAAIPDDFELNEKQDRVKYAALSGNTVVEPGLAEALASMEWPCHYLDFETVAAALPLYEGHSCHSALLTQFSVHHRDTLEGELRHGDFLAEAARDCGRELAEALIRELQEQGSIVVYSTYERDRINGLAESFPDLAAPLQRIVNRLKDLRAIIADYVYHPDFRGSFSIKDVLPVLVPELSYKGMDIADGGTASMKFARMVRGEINGEQIATTRRQLLDYCKLDTFAMVRLHDALHGLAAARQGAGRSL